MSRFRKIPQEIRETILRMVKEEGVEAAKAAREHGVHPRTVNNWLKKEVSKSGVSWHEHNRVKRENKQLKEIIGSLTLNLSRTKKIQGNT